MTERLYYSDSHIKTFKAKVSSCVPVENGWNVILDRTAFFPEGGGQAGDTGIIGDTAVLDTRERGDEVIHLTAAPIHPGSDVTCTLDWDKRFRRMQNHSGEHIVSGLVHSLYGLDNVGFHMGERFVTVDYSGELSDEQLNRLEYEANRAIYENVQVITSFPDPEELTSMEFRSKIDFKENVRIVNITGYDICACCAPHVRQTGEIGVIKLLDNMRHRGGIRLNMVCGFEALEDYCIRYKSSVEISNELSSKQYETPAAVRKLKEELYAERGKSAALSDKLVNAIAESVIPLGDNICVFTDGLTQEELRGLVNRILAGCNGICAAFSGTDGDYRYVLASSRFDLRSLSGQINDAIAGRGGGSAGMISGISRASKADIQSFFKETGF